MKDKKTKPKAKQAPQPSTRISKASRYYKLDDRGEPVPCDRDEYHDWNTEHVSWSVARTDLEPDGVEVSTIFLGRNHEPDLRLPPEIYETMIFGGEHGGFVRRYATRTKRLRATPRPLRW